MNELIIAKPSVEIDAALKELVRQQNQGCTILHCRYYTTEPTGVRIWPTTFLVEDTGRRGKLLHQFNISLVPQWTYHLVYNDFIRFTLVFEALSKDCSSFHLLEDIVQPFAFYSEQLQKNLSGVYKTAVFCS